MYETSQRTGAARLFWALAVALTTTLCVWRVTRDGPVLTPDSMQYVGAAHALANHGELREPEAEWHDADSTSLLQQFPPGYPTVLSSLLRVGVAQTSAIRIVDAFAAGALMFAILLMGERATSVVLDHDRSANARTVSHVFGDRWFLRATLPLFVLSLRAIPSAWMSAWSEPLFLLCVVVTAWLMMRRPTHPVWYGLAAACGNAVRYAGVSLVLAAVLWAGLTAFARNTDQRTSMPRDRIFASLRAMALAAIIPALFNGWWLLRARLHQVSTPVATVAWMGNLNGARDEAIRTVTEQLVPIDIPGRGIVATVVLVCLLVGVCITVLRYAKRISITATEGGSSRTAYRWQDDNTHDPGVCLLIAFCYLGMLTYARLFVGGSIPLDDRLLSPVFLMLGIAALLITRHWLTKRSVTMRVVCSAAIVIWLSFGVRQSVHGAASVYADRDDYGSSYWTDTFIADWIRTTGRQYALFSDDPVGTYFVSGRPSRQIPSSAAADTVRLLAQRLHDRLGVLLDYPSSFDDSADAGQLARALGLCLVLTSEEGNVWAPPNASDHVCAAPVTDPSVSPTNNAPPRPLMHSPALPDRHVTPAVSSP